MIVTDAPLLERAAHLDRITAALRSLDHGAVRGALVFEGTAGTGKTVLLRALVRQAADQGFQILEACGCEFEHGLSFGVVRQLFERHLASLPPDRRRAALAGPAAPARTLFGDPAAPTLVQPPAMALEAATPVPAGDDLLHGLYWLCLNLAAQRPLVLVIDDLHWSDTASLRFLRYLGHRLRDDHVLLAAACRPAAPTSRQRPPAAALFPEADVVALPILSVEAIRNLLVDHWGAEPAAGVAEACLESTRGNPYLLSELIAHLRQRGVDAAAPGAAAVARQACPPAVARWVTARLAVLPEDARQLAAAVGVLGGGVDLRRAADVAELTPARAGRALEVLHEEALLDAGPPLDFTCPLLRAVVYQEQPPLARDQAHVRAARALATVGASAVEVARHLRRSEPRGEPWALEQLRAAARQHLAGGAAADALDSLRRALRERWSDGVDPELQADLGAAALRARDPGAVEHLRAAFATAAPPAREAIGLDLAVALAGAGCHEEAAALLSALEAVVDRDSRFARRVRGQRAAIAALGRPCLPRLPAASASPLGMLTEGRSAAEVSAAVERATAGWTGADLVDSDHDPLCVAGWTLALCGAAAAADRLLAAVASEAGRLGLGLARDAATAARALVHCERGALVAGERAARDVLERTAPAVHGLTGPLAGAALLRSLTEQGEVTEARAWLSRTGVDGAVPDTLPGLPLLHARALTRLAAGDLDRGLEDLDTAIRRIEQSQLAGALAVPFRTAAATALVAAGRRREARVLARAALDDAGRFGTSVQLGMALHASGLVSDRSGELRPLTEAVTVLEGTAATLVRAAALTDLGGALRRAGQRGIARQQLRQAIALADEARAVRLRDRAEVEYRAAGGRASRAGHAGSRALTPCERRVATMAASGMRNQDIAHSLFVTVKTVEWHLTQAYRKLGIASRLDLPRALRQAVAEGQDR